MDFESLAGRAFQSFFAAKVQTFAAKVQKIAAKVQIL